MKVLTLLNEKGGVGKTTLAVHLAAGLAIRGARVLLIDADAQAHSTQQMQIAEFGGLYRMLVQDAAWKEVLRVPPVEAWAADEPRGRLWLLPSNIETRAISAAMGDDAQYLRDCLEQVRKRIDVVVIDTAPTPSLLHAVIYLASDYIIYPAIPEMLSLDGLHKSLTRRAQHNMLRAGYGLPALELLGVVPSMTGSSNAHKYGMRLLEENLPAGSLLPGLRARTTWRDASYKRMTVFAHAPGSTAASEAWTLIDAIQAHLKGAAQHAA